MEGNGEKWEILEEGVVLVDRHVMLEDIIKYQPILP